MSFENKKSNEGGKNGKLSDIFCPTKMVTRWIRENDLFGFVINLNFDRQGDAHKTLFGGIYSLFIKIFLIIYLWLNVSKIFTHVDDNNVTTVGALDLENIGDVSMHFQTSLLAFFVIRK